MWVRYIPGGEDSIKKNFFTNYSKKKFKKKNNVLFIGTATLDLPFKKLKKIINNYKDCFFFDIGGSSHLHSTNKNYFRPVCKKLNLFKRVFCSDYFFANWMNKQNRSKKFVFAPFPNFQKNNKIIPYHKKKYEVIFTGGIFCNFHLKILKQISNYKYVFSCRTYKRRFFSLSKSPYIFYNIVSFFIKVTNLSSEKYKKILAQSKICICINLSFLNSMHLKSFVQEDKKKLYYNYNHIIKTKTCANFKERMYEAANSKTLMLVYKDRWNLVEKYFVANQDFIYFKDTEDLKIKIDKILTNYENYIKIIESAYNKSKKYTFDNFIKHKII